MAKLKLERFVSSEDAPVGKTLVSDTSGNLKFIDIPKPVEVEMHILTALDIERKYIDLYQPVLTGCGSEIKCEVVNGSQQFLNSDFIVTNNSSGNLQRIGWNALGLDSLGLVPGDSLIFTYPPNSIEIPNKKIFYTTVDSTILSNGYIDLPYEVVLEKADSIDFHIEGGVELILNDDYVLERSSVSGPYNRIAWYNNDLSTRLELGNKIAIVYPHGAEIGV